MKQTLTFDKLVFVNYVFSGVGEIEDPDITFIFSRKVFPGDYLKYIPDSVLKTNERRLEKVINLVSLALLEQIPDKRNFDEVEMRIFERIGTFMKNESKKEFTVPRTYLIEYINKAKERLTTLQNLRKIYHNDYRNLADQKGSELLHLIPDIEDARLYSLIILWVNDKKIENCLFLTKDRHFKNREKIYERTGNLVKIASPKEFVKSLEIN